MSYTAATTSICFAPIACLMIGVRVARSAAWVLAVTTTLGSMVRCGGGSARIGVANGTASYPPDSYGAIGEVIDAIVPAMTQSPHVDAVARDPRDEHVPVM